MKNHIPFPNPTPEKCLGEGPFIGKMNVMVLIILQGDTHVLKTLVLSNTSDWCKFEYSKENLFSKITYSVENLPFFMEHHVFHGPLQCLTHFKLANNVNLWHYILFILTV